MAGYAKDFTTYLGSKLFLLLEVVLQLLAHCEQDADDPERFVNLGMIFVSNLQTSGVLQPGKGSLDAVPLSVNHALKVMQFASGLFIPPAFVRGYLDDVVNRIQYPAEHFTISGFVV